MLTALKCRVLSVFRSTKSLDLGQAFYAWMTNFALVFLIIFTPHGAAAYTCEKLFVPTFAKTVERPPTPRQIADFDFLLLRMRSSNFLHKEVRNFSFTPSQYYELAKVAAKMPSDTNLHNYFEINDYRSITRDQAFEIALILAKHNGYSLALNLPGFARILPSDQLYKIALLAAGNDGWALSLSASSLKKLSTTQLLRVFKAAYKNESIPRNKLTIALNFSEILPKEKVSKFLSPLVISEQKYDELAKIQKLSELKKFFLDNEEVISYRTEVLDLAWDRIKKRETGLRIIEEALRLVVRQKPIPHDSLQLLSQVSGLKLGQLRKDISKDSLGRIYELIFDIQENLFAPVFSKINISPEIYENSNLLIQLLIVVRDHKSILGNQRDGALKTLALIENKTIDKNNLPFILSELQSSFILSLRRVLSSSSLNITYENIEQLRGKFASLDPIYTLIARYQGNPNWRVLLPQFAEVFQASLNNSFRKLKFVGTNLESQNKIEKQLSGLKTKEAMNEWQKPRTLVNIISKVDSLKTKELVHTDFDSLYAATRISTQSFGKQGLALTVLNSDPGFLLTSGDLVKTYSCHNYRTGIGIDTLLGSVLDANVQVMASFVLESNHFKTPKDFLRVFNSYELGSKPEVVFDGNLLKAQFIFENGEIIETLHLGYAFLRQVVKLGENKALGKAAIYLEPEYLQTHAALAQLRTQHQTLLNSLLQSTDATSLGPITIYESVNPLGHYSDIAGGVKIDNYVVTPK